MARTNKPVTQQTTAQVQSTQPEEAEEDKKQAARKAFLNLLDRDFRDSGFEATAFEESGELTIVSDALKMKPSRDELVRREFGPKVRHIMCAIGFKTLSVKSSAFSDGDSYSLGCSREH